MANVARDALRRVEKSSLLSSHNSFYCEQLRDQFDRSLWNFSYNAILREDYIVHVNVYKSVRCRRLSAKNTSPRRMEARFSRAQNVLIYIFRYTAHIWLLRGKLPRVKTDVRLGKNFLFSRPPFRSFISFISQTMWHVWYPINFPRFRFSRNWII